ncbi:protein FAM117A isoform X2 [Esox lucius]|uniref:protein FAM117A isoform X2 n=1 Tax=Esox lucius TaxID=8010 RepID=UPI00097341F2|nr:protein FAM117A isoform X2 [Esox lucius]
MSCRSGVGLTRGATSGPQPLRATVPFQLHKPQTSLRNEKTKARQVTPGMRRTMSLDAIVGPYLQGHWPKEPEVQASLCRKDQSTQTPDSWSDKAERRRGRGVHKRSASWGSAEHLREMAKLKHQLQHQCLKSGVSGGHERVCHHNYLLENYSPVITQTQPVTNSLMPLYKLTPPLHRSVEGLNQELEGMFVCQLPHHQRRILEVPDGHRAPVPLQSCISGSQSEPSAMPPSSTPSPSTSPDSGEDLPLNLDPAVTDGMERCLLSLTSSQGGWEAPPLLISSSPRPNKSYCFQREPPEGCEKIRVCEEASIPRQAKSSLSSCPDPNKVNFTPHGGSAFCPVSLLKPLLPSMDLLFRSLAVSPANGCFGQGTAHHQSPSPGFLGPQPDSSTTAM